MSGDNDFSNTVTLQISRKLVCLGFDTEKIIYKTSLVNYIQNVTRERHSFNIPSCFSHIVDRTNVGSVDDFSTDIALQISCE